MPKSASERFRANIIALRKARGWTQEKSAEKCSMGEKTWQHLELGIRSNPTLKILEKISKGMGVEIGDLFK